MATLAYHRLHGLCNDSVFRLGPGFKYLQIESQNSLGPKLHQDIQSTQDTIHDFLGSMLLTDAHIPQKCGMGQVLALIDSPLQARARTAELPAMKRQIICLSR